MNKAKRKIDYMVDSCKKVLQSFEVQGYDNIVFTALFYQKGKKLNSLGRADANNFSKLIRSYEKTENPDKVKIEFYNADADTLLWSKEFGLADTSVEPVSVQGSFQGFGEAEINDIVSRKISDYEKIKENEALREQLENLASENEELKGELEEASAQLEAKKQMEYYANLLGVAMPGLAKVLGKTQAGQTLGFLSGTEEEPQQPQIGSDLQADNKTTIVQMVNEYLQSLDNITLGKIYLIMCEFNGNSELIGKTLQFLTNNNQRHEQRNQCNDKEDNLQTT